MRFDFSSLLRPRPSGKTVDGNQRGFQARSVVGGVFIRLLEARLR